MESLWNDSEAEAFQGDLGLRVYTSRLLGRDKTLVMHGGGNTSVKLRETSLTGKEEDILYVKGSGWDLETIAEAGFSPVKMAPLLELAKLAALSDAQMANELRCNLTRADAPMPSVEAILHAVLPYKYVDHTHADAFIAVSNSPDGEHVIRELYGDLVVVVPYIMPGFKLAHLVAQTFPTHVKKQTIGLALLHHGLFSFGQTAKESYERMIDLVNRAEQYLQQHNAWHIAFPAAPPLTETVALEIARVRKQLSDIAGYPMLLHMQRDDQTLAFATRADLRAVSQQGPATPDHVLRTKRLPLVGRDVHSFAAAYKQYFDHHVFRTRQHLTMLDAAPRVILDEEWGMSLVGRSMKDIAITNEIYRHTIDIILRATALGGWTALADGDIFDVEYWDLEQAKLNSAAQPPMFAGEIALVTGAASGIGRACAESLLARGAAVVGVDINPAIGETFKRPDFLGIQGDVGDENALLGALEAGVRHFGGLDMLILNAGVFPNSTPIDMLTLADWDRVMRVNLDANLVLLREAHALLKLAPNNGRVVIVASKNVPAPGKGQAAYSASKAALTQMGRVAALEWGADHIRVNIVHPNMVFDTALWTPELLHERAKSYGMTVHHYKTNNVLHSEVHSHDVGEVVAELCGPRFAKTTGAQIPIDGGNERVI
ncbi:MAG: bifunctional aldolase/short-chain dehydrogenase [Chloroflexi bacterium]|nr:bifunctional aldolase/short-chain dehydrogenase [Chloroflexota bacterium]